MGLKRWGGLLGGGGEYRSPRRCRWFCTCHLLFCRGCTLRKKPRQTLALARSSGGQSISQVASIRAPLDLFADDHALQRTRSDQSLRFPPRGSGWCLSKTPRRACWASSFRRNLDCGGGANHHVSVQLRHLERRRGRLEVRVCSWNAIFFPIVSIFVYC